MVKQASPHEYRGLTRRSPLITSGLVTEAISETAQRHPDSLCLVEIGTLGTETGRITYRALDRAVRDRAAQLHHEIGPGVPYVGVCVANTIDDIVDLLAVLRLGSAAVIVDAADPPDRRAEQLTLLCGAIIETKDRGRRVRHLNPELKIPVDSSDPVAFVVYTTGSTATSKPVAQSHYSVLVNVTATILHHRLQHGESMACALPVSHVNGLHFGVIATLLSGGTCQLFQRFDPLRYLCAVDTWGAARATTVPSLLQALTHLRRWPRLQALRYFVSAAAPLAPATAAAVYERGGHRIVQGYGLSECMNFATTMPTDLRGAAYEDGVLRAEVPPVGNALYGCEVEIVDPDGRVRADGTVGEVGVRGHSLMSGYIGDPAATRQAFDGGWLRTGDLGRLDPSTRGERWLTLVGRQKNVAKCGGVSVSLEELDRWVMSLPGVRGVCCVRRPDVDRGDAVTIFYVPAEKLATAPIDVVGHVGRRFDVRTLGLRTVRTDTIPALRSGKVDRRDLERRASAARSTV
jgi:acyl-CoA synthetase (AMP-forming)/AMP-acid ligase II